MFYRISLNYKKYDYSLNLHSDDIARFKLKEIKEIKKISEEEYICGLIEELRSTLIRDVIGLDNTVNKIVDICGGAT